VANDKGAVIEAGKTPLPFESLPEHAHYPSAPFVWDEPLSTRRTIACNCGRYWSTLHWPVDYPRVTNLELILEAHLEDPTASDQELYDRVERAGPGS
jgi:hypothetical protein